MYPPKDDPPRWSHARQPFPQPERKKQAHLWRFGFVVELPKLLDFPRRELEKVGNVSDAYAQRGTPRQSSLPQEFAPSPAPKPHSRTSLPMKYLGQLLPQSIAVDTKTTSAYG